MLTNISPKKTTDGSRVCKPMCMNTPRDRRDWSWLPRHHHRSRDQEGPAALDCKLSSPRQASHSEPYLCPAARLD